MSTLSLLSDHYYLLLQHFFIVSSYIYKATP